MSQRLSKPRSVRREVPEEPSQVYPTAAVKEKKPLNDYLFTNVKIKAPFRTTLTSPLNKSREEGDG